MLSAAQLVPDPIAIDRQTCGHSAENGCQAGAMTLSRCR